MARSTKDPEDGPCGDHRHRKAEQSELCSVCQSRVRQNKTDKPWLYAPVESPFGNLLRVPAVRKSLGEMPHQTYYDRLNPKSKHHDKDLPKPLPYLGGRTVYVLEADHLNYLAKKIAKFRGAGGK